MAAFMVLNSHFVRDTFKPESNTKMDVESPLYKHQPKENRSINSHYSYQERGTREDIPSNKENIS